MKKRLDGTTFASHAVFILLCFLTVIPLIFLLIISLTAETSILDTGYTFFPAEWTTEAYNYIFRPGNTIGASYVTTLFITVVGTVCSVVVTSMLAYVLSRTYRFKRLLSYYVFIPMLFGAGIIPTYILYTQTYHLKNNILVLILPFLVSSWNAILLRTFFQDVAGEVIEAAIIDGAGEFTIFYRVVAPMAKPAIATIALLTMLSFWNQWSPSMVYMTKANLQTLQYYLYRLIQDASLLKTEMDAMGMGTQSIPSEAVKYAAAIVVMGPTLLVFPFFQKYFVRGISAGSVKG